MDISCKQQIDQRPYIIILNQKQSCQTSPINTNEQTSEPLPTATSNDANKQLEPIVLYTHINKDQKHKTKYVIKTALSYISFLVTNPSFISVQSDPFLILLTAPCHKKRTDAKAHRKKILLLHRITSLTRIKCIFPFSAFPTVPTHFHWTSIKISNSYHITINRSRQTQAVIHPKRRTSWLSTTRFSKQTS